MTSLIKTPRQLITIVVLAFAVPIAVGVLVSQLVTSGEKGMDKDDNKVLARIQPVGEVVLVDASGPKGALTGEQVYGQVCKICHDAGLAGAPKIGDKAAWRSRIAAGEKTLDQRAIAGFQGKAGAMPAKGGNADLTDDEVRRAVVYIANKSGASWKEPAAATTAPMATTSAPAVATSVATSAATSAATPAAAGKADGKRVFESTCTVCHGAGIAGAPKVGDKAAWAPRIAQGINVLYAHAIVGLTGKTGVMPPKGGNLSLTDPDVKAAVDFMVAASK